MAKITLFSASLRKDSLNKKLIKNAHRLLAAVTAPHEIELISFNDFSMPVYDGDIEAKGIPAEVAALAAKISSSTALVISTPEYNGGIAGPFKNAIDWVSRVKPVPWAAKHILLLGASPGALGAVRGLWHSRVPLEVTGAFVYPEMFGLPHSHAAFDENDHLKDAASEERLKALLTKFVARI